MKRIAIIIAACFLNILTASAKCGGSGVFILGDTRTLYKNSVLILEFYAASQDLVPGIGNKYLVWLKSKNAKVALQPIEILKGEMSVTEVILRPTCDLIEGDVYELVIDNLKDWRGPQRYNSTTNKPEPYTFTIIKNNVGSIPLSFTSTPLETKKDMEVFGCGPARSVHFSIAADPSVNYVRANVKNNTTGKITTYILAITNGEVIIGHGMCSGAFLYDEGEKFTVSFALLDNAANAGKYSDGINFTKPVLGLGLR
jgi:hypothetical protein